MGKLAGALLLLGALGACSSTSGSKAMTTVVAITCGRGTHLEGTQCEVDEPSTAATQPASTAATDPPTTSTPPTDPPATLGPEAGPPTVSSPTCSTSQHLDAANNRCVVGAESTNSSVVSTVAEFPVEEIAAVLAGPLRAWMLKPSGPGFDAIAAVAQSLLDDGRKFPPIGPVEAANVRIIVQSLSSYPGNDKAVYRTADSLRFYMPSIPFVLNDGDYAGSDVPAGSYRTVGPVEDCYWETLDGAGNINDNNFVSASPQVIMRVRASDFAVNSSGCGPWVRTG